MLVSAHRTFKRGFVLAFILSVCCLKVIPVSYGTCKCCGSVSVNYGCVVEYESGFVCYIVCSKM